VRRSTGAPPPSSKPGDKVTEQEFSPEKFLSLTDCPGEPGCPALILLDETTLDNTFKHAQVHRRHVVKVFTPSGVQDFADVLLYDAAGVYTRPVLTGRTILPDGRAVALGKENIHMKEERHAGRVRVRRNSVTFPGVVPGAIIDCSWTEVHNITGKISRFTWGVQREIPVMKSVFTMKERLLGFEGVDAGLQRFHVGSSPERASSRFTASNIPSLPKEPLSPPFAELQFRVSFFVKALEKEWLGETAGVMAGKAGLFMDDSPRVAALVSRLVPATDPPAAKAATIYRYVQEKVGTEEDRLEAAAARKERQDVNADEVLARGYGDSMQRTFLFLAMAKAAGLEGSLLIVATRDNAILDVRLPDPGQFDDLAAAVRIGEQWVYYDPATKHCPIGSVAPEKEGVGANALLVAPRKGAGAGRIVLVDTFGSQRTEVEPYKLVSIPVSQASRHVLSREAQVEPHEDGSAEIDVTEKGAGLVDLDIRRRFELLGEEERRAEVVAALARAQPLAQSLTFSLEDISSFDRQARIRYRYTVPDFVRVLQDRLMMTPSVFESRQPMPFGSETRFAPVVFQHAQKTRDRIVIKIPEGYEVPVLPERRLLREGPFQLTAVFSRELDTIVFTRILEVDAIVWPADGYARLRGFFMKVQEADRQELVLARR